MRHFTLPCILIFILSFPLLAQVPDTLWTRVFGNDENNFAFSLSETSDDGFIVFGFTDPGEQAILIKVNSIGIEQWSQLYGNTIADDRFYSGFQLSDDRYIIAGITNFGGNGLHDFWLMKTDSEGNTEWEHTYGGSSNDVCYCVHPTSEGGFILAGSTSSFGNENTDWWLVKTDQNGNQEWNHSSGVAEYDVAYDAKQTTDGGYILVGGKTPPEALYADICVTKTDASGVIEWTYTYGELNNHDYGRAVIQTDDGGFAAIGLIRTGYNDICLIKLDAVGNEEWVQELGDPDYPDYGYSLCQDADYGYILGTSFYNFDAHSIDAKIIKTDPLGNIVWEKVIGDAGEDNALFVYINSNYEYMMTGSTTSYGDGDYDIWLACIEAEVTPRPFTLLTPTDSQMLHTSEINFSWSSSSSFFPEFDVRYDLSINMTMPDLDTTTFFYDMTDTAITLTVFDLTGLEEWDQMITGTWHVEAIAGPDTTMCDSDFIFRVSALQGNHESADQGIPETFKISNIYPNPFNSSTTVTISIPEKSDLCLSVYNITGQEVAILADRQVESGYHDFVYDAKGLSSGVYFIHAYVPGKMNVIKKVVFLQ